ncbi:MAG: enolase C-terminal domain-like protein [Candidatus Dormibacteraceae bacterium]
MDWGGAVMRITDIRCIEVTGTMEDPDVFWEERLIRPVDIYPQFRAAGPEFLPREGECAYRMRSIFVQVDTDRGVSGIGGPIPWEQAMLIRRVLRPLLLGADPLATEWCWDVMYRACVHGRKGLEMMAISALDCALWDFKGRHFGVPVWQLLGGPTRDRIPAYASALGFSLEPERVRDRVAALVAEGYTATKWFPRHGPLDGREGLARNLALARVLREAAGPDVDLMIDAWMSWDVPYALRFADAARELDLRWLEEPVQPDRIEAYTEITRQMPRPVLVAGGEHEYTRFGLHGLMQARAMQVFQPDTYWAGGITEMVKIAALASAHGVVLIPHGHSVPANANLSFSQPAPLIPLLEYLVKWNVIHQWFLKHPVRPVDGYVTPPVEPGLGMDLDDAKIESRRELTFD